jgi:hypothetical protein
MNKLQLLREQLGPRPTIPEGQEDNPEMTWRHGACFMWDKIIKLINELEA